MLCLGYSETIGKQRTLAHNNVNMPADFSSYLLSTSPPGFDLAYTIRDKLSPKSKRNRNITTNTDAFCRNSSVQFSCSDEDYNEVTEGIANLLTDFPVVRRKSNSLPLGFTKFNPDRQNQNENNNSDHSVNVLKKKSVSFADDMGQQLVEVRFMYEASDDPPTFSMPTEVLSSLAQGAQAAVTDSPPLVLNFAQPASNYGAFREKLEKSNVSLENVIVKEYHLLGTVKVKNIAFEKKVLVRYTSDSWSTVCDVEATYVPTANTSGHSSPYDTFSFQLNIPPTFDPAKEIKFAVLYEANGQQYWDNNNGQNYEVVSSSARKKPREKTQDNGVYDLHHDDRWTEFSNWSNVDNSIPYW